MAAKQTGYDYYARLVRVIDGDTAVLDIDCGFCLTYQNSFRLFGINAPEIRGVSDEEKSKGEASKAELERLLALGSLTVETFGTGKYGRWLAKLFVTQDDGAIIDANQALLDDGFAVPYP